ncbi:uncharacterized protein BXZ73DRAFT_107308, partial [Epithele typhae]|uniref:uncharacterized protein n=1 Tax=Epithele typhae TaxID=378194 RepID=UPI002007770D
MSYYLCVDCGGSKTAAAIADKDGTILARGTGGPSNVAYLGVPNFIRAVSATVAATLRALPAPHAHDGALPPPADAPVFAAAWLGVSGADSAATIAKLVPPLRALLGCEPVMHDDVRAAIGCVSGTGGIVVSFRKGDGRG